MTWVRESYLIDVWGYVLCSRSVARPGVDDMAHWFSHSGRAWFFGGTLNPGLPPGATGGRPSATGFRNASVGVRREVGGLSFSTDSRSRP